MKNLGDKNKCDTEHILTSRMSLNWQNNIINDIKIQ